MTNIIFDAGTGITRKLDDDYTIAQEEKRKLNRLYPDKILLWITPCYHPVWTSRGEYLGYISPNGGFWEVI